MATLSFFVVLIFVSLPGVLVSYGQYRKRFGNCLPGHESCSECYLTLKESLLSRDDNIQKLSAAFFPWNASNPIFVTVTYEFNNSNHSDIWYWTTDSSYLFFEITTFQYLSLFFSKPATLFSQKVTLTLDEDCIDAALSNDSMIFQLLTQRLKNLIEKKRFNPEIDEDYFAKSERNTENLLTSTAAIYIFVFHIIGYFIAVGITILLLWIYFNTKRWDQKLLQIGSERNKFYKYSQSKIFSISLTSGILMLYILALDIIAAVTLKDKTPALAERNIDDNILPYIMLSFDSLMVLIWSACWILSFLTCCRNSTCKLIGKHQYLVQAISTVGPVFTLVIHLPYIAIAYLNDASYATSTFIYYTVVLFVIFGALELTYGTFQQALIASDEQREKDKEIGKNKQSRNSTLEESQHSNTDSDPERAEGAEKRPLIPNGDKKEGKEVEGGKDKDEDICDGPCFPFCTKNEKLLKCMWGITIPFFALIVLTLIGLTTAALVVIPISKAFNDAPNRLVGFYQTAIVVAGVYIAYKGFFKKKPTFETAIKKRIKHILKHGSDKRKNQKWKRLSKDEKVAAFYDYVVELVAQYDPEQRKPKQDNKEETPNTNPNSIPNPIPGDQVGGTSEVTVDVTPGNEELAEGDGGLHAAEVAGDSGVGGGRSEEPREQQ